MGFAQNRHTISSYDLVGKDLPSLASNSPTSLRNSGSGTGRGGAGSAGITYFGGSSTVIGIIHTVTLTGKCECIVTLHSRQVNGILCDLMYSPGAGSTSFLLGGDGDCSSSTSLKIM